MANPPPLPPRNTSQISLSSDSGSSISHSRPRQGTIHLTPHSASLRPPSKSKHPYSGGFEDPRSSSTQSLRPVESAGTNRRTLLLIYIHGFLGDETSFKSFPAHVHNLLTMTLTDTHVVYTKIYPRYKSRKNISVARDDFSNWLVPHESPQTDIILVGHSLGGILAAEVVLLPSHTPGSQDLYQHRLLGLIAFDVPFLGMHPGVVSTGIASLFRSPPDGPAAAKTSDEEACETSNPSSYISDPFSHSEDPNYNPSYPNDVRLPKRTGKVERAWYFWNKHWGELAQASKSYVTSHFEFGGCLADYPGLRKRYDAVRALEDVDDLSKPQASNGRLVHRVRFVNYYSASTGRIKEREQSRSPNRSPDRRISDAQSIEMRSISPRPESALSARSSPGPGKVPSPRLSLEEHRDNQIIAKELEVLSIKAEDAEKDNLSPSAEPEGIETSQFESNATQADDELPPIPALPDPPQPLDESRFTNAENLKIAQKDYARQVKGYERAKKDREKSIRDRERLTQKREKQTQKQQEKAARLMKQQQEKQQKEQLKRSTTLNPESYDKQMQSDARTDQRSATKIKKQRDRKFCALPAKDPQTGTRDATWIRVYMEGMDEVVAHTSMFIINETYARLVGDTTTRVEEWIREDATRRAVMEEMDAGAG